jgi:hypothetical protein
MPMKPRRNLVITRMEEWMSSKSTSRKHGWILAVAVATFFACTLLAMLNLVSQLGPDYYFSERTTHIVSGSTKAPASIATQDVYQAPSRELEINAPSGSWAGYRSRPSSTLAMIVEPTGSVRLQAPTTLPGIEGLQSAIAFYQQRSDEEVLKSSKVQLTSIQANRLSTELLDRSSDRIWIGSKWSNKSWPMAIQLIKDIERLESAIKSQPFRSEDDLKILTWSEEIKATLHNLAECSNLTDVRAAAELDQLHRLTQWFLTEAQGLASDSNSHTIATRIAYGVLRRTDVWKAVYRCTQQLPSRFETEDAKVIDIAGVRGALNQVIRDAQATGDIEGWRAYLVLDDIEKIAQGNAVEIAHASVTAQTFLNRVLSTQATLKQRQFLDLPSVRELSILLQPMAASPVDFKSLLTDLEMLEADSEHRARVSFVAAMHSLRYADDADQVAVSQAIETHYRNANLRIALSAELLNRLLPRNKVAERPVRQNVLGADTRGNSQVDTTLQISLVPDQEAWNIRLHLDGKVKSSTRSSRGPATFFNASNATIDSTRILRLTAKGIQVQAVPTQVKSNESLRGFNTDYDGLPVIGDMVRYLAQREFSEQRGPARKIMQRSIARQTDEEFDKQLESQISKAETALDQRLLGPLRNLNLNPSVTDLSTTNDRLIARYRIASDECLGACTPRPQAPSDALISMQMHQSAMNNTFASLGLSLKDWTIHELATKLAEQLGQDPSYILAEDVPQNVIIRFTEDRPVTMEFIEGKMWLTLRIAMLAQAGRIELRDFTIRTSYVPAVNGLDAALLREGAISVDGDRLSMRERLPLRAIFAKVFAARSSIPLVSQSLLDDPRSEGLSISQVVMEEGWLALAVSDARSPHVAALHNARVTR